jgi:signal transduction histidine kinase
VSKRPALASAAEALTDAPPRCHRQRGYRNQKRTGLGIERLEQRSCSLKSGDIVAPAHGQIRFVGNGGAPLLVAPLSIIRSRAGARRTIPLTDGALGASIKIEADIPAQLWTIKIDPAELELALLNLGINARDAMPNGGVLRISAENRSVGDERLGLDGEYLTIEVRDEGSGIPPQILPRIFDPFFTTLARCRSVGADRASKPRSGGLLRFLCFSPLLETIGAMRAISASINCDYRALSANFRFCRGGPPTD